MSAYFGGAQAGRRSQSPLDNNELGLVVDGKKWMGWETIRITMGIERFPAEFEVKSS